MPLKLVLRMPSGMLLRLLIGMQLKSVEQPTSKALVLSRAEQGHFWGQGKGGSSAYKGGTRASSLG